jgi:copper chaperone
MFSFHVVGMTCEHCCRTIAEAIRKVAPNAKVEVDLGSGAVTVANAHKRSFNVDGIRASGYETQ